MNSCCHPILSKRLSLRSRHVVVFLRLAAVDSVTLADLLYIVTSFTIWGNVASVLHHRALPSIITREHEIDAARKHGHQLLQITSAAHDVLGRIVGPPNTEAPCRPGHQLHQPLRAFRATSILFEPRFLLDHAKDQVRVDPKPGSIHLY